MLRSLFFLLFFTGVCTQATAQTVEEVWSELGESASPRELGLGIAPGERIFDSRMRFNSAQVPHVVFSSYSRSGSVASYEIHVVKWSGTEWTGMDGSEGGLLPAAWVRSHQVDLAFDSEDRPVVAAIGTRPDDQSEDRLSVYRWDGTEWQNAGELFGRFRRFDLRPSLSVIVDGDDDVWVAWVGYQTMVKVMRLNESGWSTLFSEPGILPALIKNSEGYPLFGHCEINGDPLRIAEWTGEAWNSLGTTPVFNTFDKESLTLALDIDGTPMLAYTGNESDGTRLYAMRWNGTVWLPLGDGGYWGAILSEGQMEPREPQFAATPEDPLLSWLHGDRYRPNPAAMRWNGSTWAEIFPGSRGNLVPYFFDVVRFEIGTLSNHSPVVFASGHPEPFARKFSGGQWHGLGPGSEPSGGVTRVGIPSSAIGKPELFLDEHDNPIVSHVLTLGASREVVFQQWDGHEWDSLPRLPFAWTSDLYNVETALHLDQPTVALRDGSDIEIHTLKHGVWGSDEIHLPNPPSWDFELVSEGDQLMVVVRTVPPQGPPAAVTVYELHDSMWVAKTVYRGEDIARGFDADIRGATTAIAWERSVFVSMFNVYLPRPLGIAVRRGDEDWSLLPPPVDAPSRYDQYGPSIVLDSEELPVVAWNDGARIYASRWTGSGWIDVGAGSSSGEGISEVPYGATGAKLGIDNQDRIVACWNLFGMGNCVIVKRWNGAVWEEIGTGSARAPGISHQYGLGSFPVLAVDSRGNAAVGFIYASSREIYLLSTGPGFYGDANGDGVLNIADLVRLQNHFEGNPISILRDLDRADIDGDSVVTEADIGFLIDRLLGID